MNQPHDMPTGASPAASPARGERLMQGVFWCALLFLAFLAGSLVMLLELPPSGLVRDAWRGAKALVEQQTLFHDPLQTDLWRPARTDRRGVTVNAPRAFAGYTLVVSSADQKAQLLTMDGRVAHEWRLPAEDWWDARRTGRPLRPPGFMQWDHVHMYPNGDLLALVTGVGDTPWGYALIKLDRNSKLVWAHEDYVHHMLDIAPNGEIYVLANRIEKGRVPGYEHLDSPRIEDYIAVLSADGRELRRVSALEALLHSDYARMLRAISWDIEGDFLHLNSVQVLSAEEASRIPNARAGQVLVSIRELDAIAVIDMEEARVVWALKGSWHRQHDAQALPNGHVLIFDNFGHYDGRDGGNWSRVIELDPATSEIVWSYAGDRTHPLQSDIRSSEQRLPNGDTLITESDGGRVLEVSSAGEIVWEYISPVRAGAHQELIPVATHGERYTAEQFAPEFAASLPPAR